MGSSPTTQIMTIQEAITLLDEYSEALEEHVKSDYSSKTNDRFIELRQKLINMLAARFAGSG